MDLKPTIRTGMPKGAKPNPRGDFRPSEFDISILTMGYRLWWSRAGVCPCLNNDQTEQADPTCVLCKGDGHYYFCPDPAVAAGATEDPEGNAVVLSDDGTAIQIIALLTSMTQDVQVFEKFGEWTFGTSRVTTQGQNKLGYRDRLVSVESEMTWAQVIEYAGGDTISVTGGRKKTGLRYPFVQVNQLRSLAQVFRREVDYEITPRGEIHWLLGDRPAAGTRLSIHGTIRPVWVVLDHIHAYRDTNLTGKTVRPQDQVHTKMPVQSVIKLDFLVTP